MTVDKLNPEACLEHQGLTTSAVRLKKTFWASIFFPCWLWYKGILSRILSDSPCGYSLYSFSGCSQSQTIAKSMGTNMAGWWVTERQKPYELFYSKAALENITQTSAFWCHRSYLHQLMVENSQLRRTLCQAYKYLLNKFYRNNLTEFLIFDQNTASRF